LPEGEKRGVANSGELRDEGRVKQAHTYFARFQFYLHFVFLGILHEDGQVDLLVGLVELMPTVLSNSASQG
jgi:hypothetical protein